MKFGVIGFGNMGGAIVKGAVASGVLAKEDVLVYDIKESARQDSSPFQAHEPGLQMYRLSRRIPTPDKQPHQ